MMDPTTPHDIEKELIALTQQLLIETGLAYPREIKLNASLQDHLRLDSLSRAELFHRIEKTFAVTIPDRLLAEAQTLADIADYLHHAPDQAKMVNKRIIHAPYSYRYVDVSQANSLTEVLSCYAQQAPEKPHVYFQNEEGEEEVISYGQVWQSSLRVAAALREYGLKEGETVAIMLPTHPGFFYTFFGTLLAGGIPVPIYPPFRKHMLEAYAHTESRILTNAEVRILVTFDQAENLSHLLKAFVPSLKHITTVQELLKTNAAALPLKAKSEDFAFIQYTSGSTADPKGVLLTHRNLLANIRSYGQAIAVNPETDIAVSWLPLYHDMGLIGMWLGSLNFGIPLVLLTPFSFLNHPERWLWAIHHHRGTLSGAPNFAYELCIRKIEPAMIEGLDLSCWRVAANGAEKIYPRTLEQFAAKFAPFQFKRSSLLPVYGLAESTVALTIPPINQDFHIDYIDRKAFETQSQALPSTEKNALAFVSCGKALPQHHLRIVDSHNQPLAQRRVGRLQFSGPSTMQGYYHHPQATAAIYHDGWVDTGDLAYIADDELFITGRHKDLIIKAGRNLYPADIEEWVSKVAGVRQGCVAALGVNHHEKIGEQLIIVAETQETDKTKRAEMIANIMETLSKALDIVADHIVLLPPHSIPKTSSGKLQRAACKQRYLQGELGRFRLPSWLQIAKLGSQWMMRKIKLSLIQLAKCFYTAYVALLLLLAFFPFYLLMRFATPTQAASICRFTAKILIKAAFCPLHIQGIENLKQSPPVIFVANHTSYVDAIVLLSLLPPQTRFVGKKELFSLPIFGSWLRQLGYFPVDRLDSAKGVAEIQQLQHLLKQGHAIFIFPEGTFSYAQGLRPFRLGAFKLAAETATPLCAIALNGTRFILRDGEKLLRPNRILVTIAQPLTAKGGEWQDVIDLRNQVRKHIAQHCGEPSLDYIAPSTVAPRSE